MNLTIKKNRLVWFVIVSVVLLYWGPLPGLRINEYFDDLIPLCFGLIWIRWLITSCRRNTYLLIFTLILIPCAIGVISNYYAEINTQFKDIILDMYSFLKMFFVYLGTWALLSKKKKETVVIINYLARLSKIYIGIGFTFGILNLLGVVNMSEQVRFGINTFSFAYGNASQYGILVGVAIAFVIFQQSKNRLVYEILGTITMALTLKGMAFIIISVYWTLKLIHVKKIKVWNLVLLGAVLSFVLRYQISTYLLDSTAPRAMLLRYGAITAATYFPFGAGFAAYGSAMAAQHYSPLYTLYGFTDRRSLIYIPGEATALNDCYLGMSLGQFGWFGTFFLLLALGIMGTNILKVKSINSQGKYICIALYACVCGMAVMAGSVKGAVGQLMLFAITLFTVYNAQEAFKIEYK